MKAAQAGFDAIKAEEQWANPKNKKKESFKDKPDKAASSASAGNKTPPTPEGKAGKLSLGTKGHDSSSKEAPPASKPPSGRNEQKCEESVMCPGICNVWELCAKHRCFHPEMIFKVV